MVDYELITKGLKQITNDNILFQSCQNCKITIYWNVPLIEQLHFEHYLPLLKISEFIQAGCKIKILIADIQTQLYKDKLDFSQIENRVEYYIHCLKIMFQSLKINFEHIEWVKGSDFQLKPNYTLDIYRFLPCYKVKSTKEINVNSLIYPIFQSLNPEYLNADAVFTQELDYSFHEKCRKDLGYKEVPHLILSKISENKIYLLDSRTKLKIKIAQIDLKTLLFFTKKLIFPLIEHFNNLKEEDEPELDFCIYQKEQDSIIFNNYKELSKAIKNNELSLESLQSGIVEFINKLIEPVRREFESRRWNQIYKKGWEIKNE